MEAAARAAVEVGRQVLQNELNLLTELIFTIYATEVIVGGDRQSIMTEYMQLGIPPHREPINSFSPSDFTSSRLEYYCDQVGRCLDELPEWLRSKLSLIQKRIMWRD